MTLTACSVASISCSAQEGRPGGTVANTTPSTPTREASQVSKIPEPAPAEIAEWIEQLGADSFAVRELAGERLRAYGEQALPQLKLVARTSDNAEVRQRSTILCDEIDRAVFQKVTREFMLDPNPEHDYGLPAWKTFRGIVGSSRSSKNLYIQMVTHQPDLTAAIDAVANNPDDATTTARLIAAASESSRNLQIQLRFQLPELGDVVGLLTASALLNAPIPVELDDTLLASLGRGDVADYFGRSGYDRCLRLLAGRWIPKSHDGHADRALVLGVQLNIPEVVEVGRKHLSPIDDIVVREYAFRCLARYGTEQDIGLLEPYLSEETIVHKFADNRPKVPNDISEDDVGPPLPFNPRGLPTPTTEPPRVLLVRISDMALASLMLITRDEMTAAFPSFQTPTEQRFFYPLDIAFSAEEADARRKSFERWNKQRALRKNASN